MAVNLSRHVSSSNWLNKRGFCLFCPDARGVIKCQNLVVCSKHQCHTVFSRHGITIIRGTKTQKNTLREQQRDGFSCSFVRDTHECYLLHAKWYRVRLVTRILACKAYFCSFRRNVVIICISIILLNNNYYAKSNIEINSDIKLKIWICIFCKSCHKMSEFKIDSFISWLRHKL